MGSLKTFRMDKISSEALTENLAVLEAWQLRLNWGNTSTTLEARLIFHEMPIVLIRKHPASAHNAASAV